jgi:hypothetical protein
MAIFQKRLDKIAKRDQDLVNYLVLADCYATQFHRKIRPKKISKKNFRKFSVNFFKTFFLAIGVSQPNWGMPSKIRGV